MRSQIRTKVVSRAIKAANRTSSPVRAANRTSSPVRAASSKAAADVIPASSRTRVVAASRAVKAGRIKTADARVNSYHETSNSAPASRRGTSCSRGHSNMPDDKNKIGRQDRARIAGGQDYEVEDFHQKNPHLTHQQAVDIIREAKGDRKKADQLAERHRT